MHAIFRNYLELLEEAHRSKQTLINNAQAFDRFTKWLSRTELDASLVTQAEMKAFVQHLLKDGRVSGGPLKESTVKRHLTHIRAAYAHARDMGVVPLNPTAGISKLLPRVPEKAPEMLSGGDMRAVLTHIQSDRENLSFYVIALSGIRRHELLDLRWEPTPTHPSYVNFDDEQFVILGKGGKHRLVPMHSILKELLIRHRLSAAGVHTNFVIESAWHQQLSARTFNHDLRSLYDRAGLDWVEKPAHILRKTLNTNLTRQGVRPEVLDSIFGWSSQGVRSRFYTGLVSADMRDAIALAYCDDPVFPEQPPPQDAAEGDRLTEAELVRMKLELAHIERENRIAT
jgi:site-specific recombinase XerD